MQFIVLTCLADITDQSKWTNQLERAETLMDSSPEEATNLFKEVIEKANTPEQAIFKARALKGMAIIHYYQQNYRQSLEYNEQALVIYRKTDNKEGIAGVLNNTALILEIQGDFSTALKRYTAAAALYTEFLAGDKRLSTTLSNIGNVYYTLGRFDKALAFYSQSLKHSEALSDSGRLAPTYNNIGNVYLSLEDYKSAISFYLKAEKIHQKLDEKQKLSTVYNNIGEAYLGLKETGKALQFNQLSLEIARKNNDNESVIASLINIGSIFCTLNDFEHAQANYKEALRLSNMKRDRFVHAQIMESIGELKLAQKDYDEAIYSFKEALELIEESGSDLLLNNIYANLSKAWEAKGDYQRAFLYLSKHDAILDSIYDQESLNRLNMIRVSFELEQSERDNQLLRQQNIYSQLALNRQQTIRNLLIAISAIVIVSLAFLFLMYHSKKKKNDLLALSNKQILNQKEELDRLYLEQFKLNETKNKFFSIIAHDLKSPFQSLLGFSELLSLEYEHFNDEQRLDAITNMYKVTSDTYKLIENLLEWGRIQTGSAHVVKKVINMKDFVESMMPLFDLPLKNKDLQVSMEIPPILMSHADPNMLAAIFRNLLSNAIKFSYPGSVIHIKGHSGKESSKLSVTDSGIGISSEVIDKLFTFDPKVRRNGTKGETGTGMGLGLCMEFMQLNHGMIKVSSKPGEGSTFTMIMQPGSKVAVTA